MKHLNVLVLAVLVFAAPAVGEAQDQEPTGPRPANNPVLVPLRVQVVVSRWQGERRVSSLPYVLSVNANALRIEGGRPSQVRMGARVPVPSLAQSQLTVDGKPVPGAALVTGGGPVTYQDIGTQIDCWARSMTDGRFQLNVSIDDTSVYLNENGAPGGPVASGMPVFRSFRSTNDLILADGQTSQFTAATDRVNGEVTRVDVTLNVVK